MGSQVENSVEIDRSVSEVFAFVDDYKNTTRYLVGMSEYKPTTDKTSGKGARFKLVKKTTGLPDIKSEIEITEWVKDKKIAFESISGFENGGVYTFTAKGDKSVVKLQNSFDIASLLGGGGGGGGFLGGLRKAAAGAAAGAARGVAENQARKDLTGSLDKLRELIEKTPRKAAAKASPTRATAKPSAAKSTSKSTARTAPARKPAAKKSTAR